MPTKLTSRYRMTWCPARRIGDFVDLDGRTVLANFSWDDYGIKLDMPRSALNTPRQRPLWFAMYQCIAYMIKEQGL